MKSSDSIKAIAPALLKAQKEIGAAVKGSTNPFFKSKYADLGSVMEACKAELNTNGIIVLQPILGDMLSTVLLHESGEWISSETKIVSKVDNDPQAQGSAITYARRYGLQSMVFIPAEDDDGEGAVARGTTAAPAREKTYQAPAAIPATPPTASPTPEYKNFLDKISVSTNHSDLDKLEESVKMAGGLIGKEKYDLFKEIEKVRQKLPTVKI